MILSQGEKLSVLWEKLTSYLEERLESNRISLELASNEKDADKFRGRIAEDKLLLSLGEEVDDTIPNLEV